MIENSTVSFTPDALDQLQRLRISILAFQNEIAPLPATDQNDAHNEQFNQLRDEAKVLLKQADFDTQVPRAMTTSLQLERSQKTIAPRLSTIVIFGVILALLGLGLNSVILEDVLINSLGCLVSTLGMLLVVGALVVSGVNSLPRRGLTNLGDLFQLCNTLLYQISHALNMNIPDSTERPAAEIPEIASAVDLAVDSLNKQMTDWQLKLRMLEEQRLALDADTPLELTINIDFVQRELKRTQEKIDALRGRTEEVSQPLGLPTEPPVPVKPVNPQEGD